MWLNFLKVELSDTSRDRVNERVKIVKVVKVAKVARVKVFLVFQNIPGSQLLSDIQTFFSEGTCSANIRFCTPEH